MYGHLYPAQELDPFHLRLIDLYFQILLTGLNPQQFNLLQHFRLSREYLSTGTPRQLR